MNNKNCKELLNIPTITSAFTTNQQSLGENIISCLYKCYRAIFLAWARITYHKYPVDTIDFLSGSSFTDGVLKMKEAAARNELYEGNASVKTILFHYSKNVLLGKLTEDKRLAEKNKKLAFDLSTKEGSYTPELFGEEQDIRFEKLKKAMGQLQPADRQVIEWRHIEERSNEEIAELLQISVPSATNRIYRCMQRLRQILQDDGLTHIKTDNNH
jgi:RNA polymerase sigma factor (sigma-70 family)